MISELTKILSNSCIVSFIYPTEKKSNFISPFAMSPIVFQGLVIRHILTAHFHYNINKQVVNFKNTERGVGARQCVPSRAQISLSLYIYNIYICIYVGGI